MDLCPGPWAWATVLFILLDMVLFPRCAPLPLAQAEPIWPTLVGLGFRIPGHRVLGWGPSSLETSTELVKLPREATVLTNSYLLAVAVSALP